MQDSSGVVKPQTTVLTREEADRGSQGLVSWAAAYTWSKLLAVLQVVRKV